MAKNLVGKKYTDMPDAYQQRYSQDEFKARRKSQRMAGEREELKTTQYKDLSEEERGEYGSKKEYAAKRKEAINYDPYDAKKPSGIDLRAEGAGSEKGTARFSRRDAKQALESGNFTAKELSQFGKGLNKDGDDNTIYGGKAQRFLDKKVAEQKAADKGSNKPVEENKPITEVDTKPDTPSTDAQIDDGTQTGSGSGASVTRTNIARNTGNINNKGGTNYGTQNTGVIDQSVNIAGAGGGGASIGVGTENMMGSVAYNALNENQYDRSQLEMDPTARANETIAAAEEATGAGSRIAALDAGVTQMSDFYRSQSQKYLTGIFGDYFSDEYEAPMWKPPASPSKIDPNYDDDDD